MLVSWLYLIWSDACWDIRHKIVDNIQKTQIILKLNNKWRIERLTSFCRQLRAPSKVLFWSRNRFIQADKSAENPICNQGRKQKLWTLFWPPNLRWCSGLLSFYSIAFLFSFATGFLINSVISWNLKFLEFGSWDKTKIAEKVLDDRKR